MVPYVHQLRIWFLHSSPVDNIIRNRNIDEVYHLASILSATGEKDPYLAYNVNLTGTVNVLNACVTRDVKKVFIPSTIGVYGPEVQKENAPIRHNSIPTTMYGITKFTTEMLSQYYFNKYNLDVRSLRYPGLLSYKVAPTAGTTDYAVDMIKHAAQGNLYECYLKEETKLPMLYMPDAMKATLRMMTSPQESIRHNCIFYKHRRCRKGLEFQARIRPEGHGCRYV